MTLSVTARIRTASQNMRRREREASSEATGREEGGADSEAGITTSDRGTYFFYTTHH